MPDRFLWQFSSSSKESSLFIYHELSLEITLTVPFKINLLLSKHKSVNISEIIKNFLISEWFVKLQQKIWEQNEKISFLKNISTSSRNVYELDPDPFFKDGYKIRIQGPDPHQNETDPKYTFVVHSIVTKKLQKNSSKETHICCQKGILIF